MLNPTEHQLRAGDLRFLRLLSSCLLRFPPAFFAFTNAARKLGPLQRIEMERFAGTLLEGPLQ